MKRKLLIGVFIALCAGALCGCACYDSLENAQANGAVMGERILIDGVDVSGMDVGAARAAVKAAGVKRAAGMIYVISANGKSVKVSGDMLGVESDADRVLLEAVNMKRHYPAGIAPRELTSMPFAEQETLRAALSGLSAPLEREPADAYATFEGGKLKYFDAVEGCKVDTQELAGRVAAMLEIGTHELDAELITLPAGYTLEEAKRDTSLIAEFSTSYAGSTYGKRNRVFNIEKAASLINGVVVQPGKSFDMNATLGPRNGENGWREATAIREGAYTQEYGGGVCQVSTTLYNAVLMADMEVVERHHHSWPLGYIAIGRDATISTGGPNFIFLNTSDMPIYIQAFTDEKAKTVSVLIYGRHSENWASIALNSIKVESLSNPGNEVQLDTSLPAGSRVEQRKSRAGSIAETYRSFLDAEGNVLKKELISRDKYRPVKGLIYVSEDIYYASSAADAQPFEYEYGQ